MVVPGPAVVGAVAAAPAESVCVGCTGCVGCVDYTGCTGCTGNTRNAAVAIATTACGDGREVRVEKRVMGGRRGRGRTALEEAVVDGTADGGEDGGEKRSDERGADEGVEGGDDLFDLVAIESVGCDGSLEGLDVKGEREAMADVVFNERLLEELLKERVRHLVLGKRNGRNGEEGREDVEDRVDADEPVLLETETVHLGSDARHDVIEGLLGVDWERLFLQRVRHSLDGELQLDGGNELRRVGVVEGHVEMVRQHGIVEGGVVQHDVRDEEEMVTLAVVVQIRVELLVVLLLDVSAGKEADALRRKQVEFGEENVHGRRGLEVWRGGEEAVVDVQEVADGEAAAAAADLLYGREVNAVVSALAMKKGWVEDEERVEENVIPAVEVPHAPGEEGLDAQPGRADSASVKLDLGSTDISWTTSFWTTKRMKGPSWGSWLS